MSLARARSGALVALLIAACSESSGGDVPLDVEGVRLFDGPLLASQPSIVALPDGFGVAWIGRDPGVRLDRLWYARVRTDGSIAAPAAPIVEAGIVGDLYLVARASDLVAIWSESSPDRALFAAVVTVDGAVTAGPSEVAAISGSKLIISAAVAAGTLAVAYVTGDHATVQLLDAALAPAGPAITMPSTPHDHPCLFAEGGELVVMYDESGSNVRFARLGAGGTVITTATDVGSGVYPRCASATPSGGVAAWRRTGSAGSDLAALDGGAWTVLSDLLPPNRAARAFAEPARTAGTLWVTWQGDFEHAPTQIYLGSVDLAAPAPVRPELLTDPRYIFAEPAIALHPEAVGVAFSAELVGTTAIFVATFPPS